MAEERDQVLQELFAQNQPELDGKEFTAHVVARTRNVRYVVIGGCAAMTLVAAFTVWFFAVPQELAWLVVQALATPLVNLGDGWLGWMFSPVNNVGGVLVLSVKLVRMVRAKARSASWR